MSTDQHRHCWHYVCGNTQYRAEKCCKCGEWRRVPDRSQDTDSVVFTAGVQKHGPHAAERVTRYMGEKT